jgi:hypothetical protein
MLHIFTVGEFNNTLSVTANIGVDNITVLSHVVFQILPRCTTRQARNDQSIIRTSLSASSVTTTVAATIAIGSAASFGQFNSKTIAIEVVTISTSHCVLSITIIRKADKCKGWRSAWALDVDISDSSIPKQSMYVILKKILKKLKKITIISMRI